ncbi:hypothetical protein EUTSA_v10027484mg [Eutrema salsugineum]|uniref:Uncharacterized protein n=1 Tax=Eutrema salsugineum TaxID=72664 RepID=V4LZ27_EUTSA|nr:hypothetical protein EUTSA_v10027484mg [Eutrema salsugineum]
MLNRRSYFLFIIALCVGLGNTRLWAKNSIHFKNSLDLNKRLDIFCKFNKERLHSMYLHPGQTFDYSFHGKLLSKNKIDCVLRQGRGEHKYHANIRAFEGESGVFDHGKQNFWDAREDGIYFTHGKEVPKLEYKWIY